MTKVALRGRALRAWRRGRARRGVGLGLGERAFEFLEGEQELVGGGSFSDFCPNIARRSSRTRCSSRRLTVVRDDWLRSASEATLGCAGLRRAASGRCCSRRRLRSVREAPFSARSVSTVACCALEQRPQRAAQAMRDRPCRGSVP